MLAVALLEGAESQQIDGLIIIRRILGVAASDLGALFALVLDVVHGVAVKGALIVETDIEPAPTRFRRGVPVCQFHFAMRAISAFHTYYLLARGLRL